MTKETETFIENEVTRVMRKRLHNPEGIYPEDVKEALINLVTELEKNEKIN